MPIGTGNSDVRMMEAAPAMRPEMRQRPDAAKARHDVIKNVDAASVMGKRA